MRGDEASWSAVIARDGSLRQVELARRLRLQKRRHDSRGLHQHRRRSRISYTTSNNALVTALHAWFDAQVSDHGNHANRDCGRGLRPKSRG